MRHADPVSTTPEPPAARRRKAPSQLVKLTSPLAIGLAGHRWFPLWAVLRHRGRRSGKQYAIPVAVLHTPDTFVIALPWGSHTNWAQNVLAAGGCTVRYRFRIHVLGPVGLALSALSRPAVAADLRRAARTLSSRS